MKTLLIAARLQSRKTLEKVLKQRKHEVTVAEDADAACSALRSGDYRLVVVETDDPQGEGARLCRRLRTISPIGRCVILAAGESAEPEDVRALLAAGADDYSTDLNDPRRLQMRLAVAEHAVGSTDGSPAAEQPLPRMPIRCCSMLYDAPYGAARTSIEGKFLEANPALVSMLGYDSQEELLAVDLAKDVYRDPAARAPVIGASAEQARLLEVEWKRKDGTPISIRAHGNVVCDATGNPVELEGIVEDITEQKRTQEALRESEQRFRSFFDHAADGILLADTQTREIHSGNPAICRMLGYRPEEIPTLNVMDLHREEDLVHVVAVFERQAKGEQPLAREIPMKRRDGTVFYADVCGIPLMFAGKAYVAGIFRDVTERKEAERALRESETRLRALFENLPDLVVVVDCRATIQFANHDAPGATKEELIGATGFGFLVPEHQESCREAFGLTLATRQPQTVEALDIYGHWWTSRLVPMIEQDEVRSVMVICTDVTEQRTATQAIQKEQRLLRHLIELHERDRQLTAYEIHDGFSQYLAGALFHLQSFRELPAAKPEDAWKTFDAGLALINRSINETRRLIGGLRPPILDESGVLAAVDYLVCEAVESDPAEVEFVHDVQFDRLTPPLESAIFRIVQESLNNARHHSQSEKIRVELMQQDDRIHIGVRDWGIGFNPEKVEEDRFGLQGIRERVRLFGGQIAIETAPGKGTHIRVELPLIEPPSRS